MMWWTRIKACSTASESRLRGEHVHNADLVRYQSLLDGFGVETMTDGGVAVAVSGSIVSKLARRLRSRDISHPRRHAAHRGYQSLLDGFGVETRDARRPPSHHGARPLTRAAGPDPPVVGGVRTDRACGRGCARCWVDTGRGREGCAVAISRGIFAGIFCVDLRTRRRNS
jgi:hypothetical protein